MSFFRRVRPYLPALLEVMCVGVVYLLAAGAITWPALFNLNEIVIGGGELGGWLWRYWWHFMEVEALVEGEGLSLWERFITFLSLGRFPETGNILDVLLYSYPLNETVGFPAHYNIKIYLILVLDGICGYALARHLVPYRSVALVAGLIAVINPLNIQDLYGSGLRQAILWWLLLFPILLDRTARLKTPLSGAVAGVVLGLAGAFYWFYGLFGGMFLGLWLINYVWINRTDLDLRVMGKWLGALLFATAVVGGGFALPYILGVGAGEASGGGAQRETQAHHDSSLPPRPFKT